jgi:hypothetical protein
MALAMAALATVSGAAHAEEVCVRVTVIGPVVYGPFIGTVSTGYTCTNSPVPTWYRKIIAPAGPFEVIVEVVTPAGDTT